MLVKFKYQDFFVNSEYSSTEIKRQTSIPGCSATRVLHLQNSRLDHSRCARAHSTERRNSAGPERAAEIESKVAVAETQVFDDWGGYGKKCNQYQKR